MAKGRTGFVLEGWKFGLYLALPILASWYYSDPDRQQRSVDYWKYVEYPASAHTAESLQAEAERYNQQKEQRQAYRDQLRALQQQAQFPFVTMPHWHVLAADTRIQAEAVAIMYHKMVKYCNDCLRLSRYPQA